jgi:hypothetical protein
VALERAKALGDQTPEEIGYALAWSKRESNRWEALRQRRMADLGAEAADALPLEALGAQSKMTQKNVKVIAVGSEGVLLKIGKQKFLADKAQMRQALPRGLSKGRVVETIKLERDGMGRARINAADTVKAALAAAAPTLKTLSR